MKWSLKLGTYRGIPVYIHATFLLIILWVALGHMLKPIAGFEHYLFFEV